MSAWRLVRLFVFAMAAIGGALSYHRNHNVPPDCASALLRDRVHTILVTHLGLPQNVRYVLVRTLEGWFFATHFLCDAELVNDAPEHSQPGQPRRIVLYRSFYHPVTGALDVSAGIRPGPR